MACGDWANTLRLVSLTNTPIWAPKTTSVFSLTYHMRSYLGWIHAAHLGGSSPCPHCGWTRMTAHALALQWRFRRPQEPCPRFHLCQHLHLFGLQQVELAGWCACPALLCFHSTPALPRSLGNAGVKRRKGGELVLSHSSENLAEVCIPSRNRILKKADLHLLYNCYGAFN